MTERKYQFRAMLIDPDDPARAALAQRTWLMKLEELSGPIVDEYTFFLPCPTGAQSGPLQSGTTGYTLRLAS